MNIDKPHENSRFIETRNSLSKSLALGFGAPALFATTGAFVFGLGAEQFADFTQLSQEFEIGDLDVSAFGLGATIGFICGALVGARFVYDNQDKW